MRAAAVAAAAAELLLCWLITGVEKLVVMLGRGVFLTGSFAVNSMPLVAID